MKEKNTCMYMYMYLLVFEYKFDSEHDAYLGKNPLEILLQPRQSFPLLKKDT